MEGIYFLPSRLITALKVFIQLAQLFLSSNSLQRKIRNIYSIFLSAAQRWAFTYVCGRKLNFNSNTIILEGSLPKKRRVFPAWSSPLNPVQSRRGRFEQLSHIVSFLRRYHGFHPFSTTSLFLCRFRKLLITTRKSSAAQLYHGGETKSTFIKQLRVNHNARTRPPGSGYNSLQSIRSESYIPGGSISVRAEGWGRFRKTKELSRFIYVACEIKPWCIMSWMEGKSILPGNPARNYLR